MAVDILRYLDYRFRPSVRIPEIEIKQYYDKQRAGWSGKACSPSPRWPNPAATSRRS